ncbi:MAG: protein translocase subunit SecF [Patescibacteria group bacterium]
MLKLKHLADYRKWWYALSLLLIIPGTISLVLFGLKLGIDFTGGSLIEIRAPAGTAAAEVRDAFGNEYGDPVVQSTSAGTYQVRVKQLDPTEHNDLLATAQEALGPQAEELRFETVGPSISEELRDKAFLSVSLGALLILLYIAYAFRNVPKPASSWRFGTTTILTLLHDILFVIGAFSLLGYFTGLEVDATFVAALLTAVGYSVHDTIVVFDRIRENLVRRVGRGFTETVNYSIAQTLVRSLNTSLTLVLVLIAMYLFGGESLHGFVLALLLGTVIGTYSSIFNAAPLLVSWQRWTEKRSSKRQTGRDS